MKKFLRYSLLLLALALVMASCVKDDTDLADIIAQYQVEPVSIELDYSDLSETADVPVTDENDSTYNDYVENTEWNRVMYINFQEKTVEVNGSVPGVSLQTNGAHVMVMLLGPMRSPQSSRGLLDVNVTRCGSPPWAGIT